MKATKYDDGTITYPGHPVGPEGGEPIEEIDLSERVGEIVTWTTSQATPLGVRQPNHLAIVEFEVEGQSVRALGQLTTSEVEIGDEVTSTYVEELREPGAGIREPESQEWDGYRFEPTQ
jgi:uncharacterized OB-fold protein